MNRKTSMKFLFAAFLCFAWSMGILNAQGFYNIQQKIAFKRIRRGDLMRQEWSRGYAQGSADHQTRRGYNDRGTLAISRNLPTSEAYQSGYRAGYYQRR